MVDSQENGIRLVHSLMACAEAVQKEDFKLAEALMKNIGFLAVSQADAIRKVATYFAEALYEAGDAVVAAAPGVGAEVGGTSEIPVDGGGAAVNR
ncbi:hypothetical protein SASPL_135103 [Salvia splendens]|uniref:DELLA protein n=1 Tax=Salvia splendens TaxID=180675 RepID=A0A8X8WY58_SALSN|nr:hypothetical protein SASPL_135103 [Salvia splendens]